MRKKIIIAFCLFAFGACTSTIDNVQDSKIQESSKECEILRLQLDDLQKENRILKNRCDSLSDILSGVCEVLNSF